LLKIHKIIEILLQKTLFVGKRKLYRIVAFRLNYLGLPMTYDLWLMYTMFVTEQPYGFLWV
jgi:hypothetical protein